MNKFIVLAIFIVITLSLIASIVVRFTAFKTSLVDVDAEGKVTCASTWTNTMMITATSVCVLTTIFVIYAVVSGTFTECVKSLKTE